MKKLEPISKIHFDPYASNFRLQTIHRSPKYPGIPWSCFIVFAQNFVHPVRKLFLRWALLIPVMLATLISASGCQNLLNQAESLKKEGEKAVNAAEQQFEKTKKQIIETKEKIEEKARQLDDAGKKIKEANDAVNKLTK